MQGATAPTKVRGLRACRRCKLVKAKEQFQENFCENCPDDVPDRVNAETRSEYIHNCTTTEFEGLVAMMNPGRSWVAKRLKMNDDGKVVHYKPGVYAIYVSTGGTEHDQEQELERRLAEEEEEEAADDDFIDDDLGHGSQNKSTNKQGALFEDEDDEM